MGKRWAALMAVCCCLALWSCNSSKSSASKDIAHCFPEWKADTVHLASWCGKEDEPEFKSGLCGNVKVAKLLGLDPGTFRCVGQMPLDKQHTLYVVETYSGMCATTFQPYVHRKGDDTLGSLAIPFANALYGDGEMRVAGDVLLSENADEVWLFDHNRPGGLKYIFSGWSQSCVAVESQSEPGKLESQCETNDQPPAIYAWDGSGFIQIFLAHPDWYVAQRHRKVEKP